MNNIAAHHFASESNGTASTFGYRKPQNQLWSPLREVYELLRISADTLNKQDDDLQFQHLQAKAGQYIYAAGQPFNALYLMQSGFIKTVHSDEFGHEHVLSFPMRGDLVGFDGMYTRQHGADAIALSDCILVLLPFRMLVTLCHQRPELENALHGAMALELAREQSLVGMVGTFSAEARVARFLLMLAERYAQMGYSRQLFNLRMTRGDIGSYLGLTVETVSRSIHALGEIGLITVDQRTIGITDADGLRNLRRLPPCYPRRKPSSRAHGAETKLHALAAAT